MKVTSAVLVTLVLLSPSSYAQRRTTASDLVSIPPAIDEALRTAPFSCSSAPFLTCENSVTTNPSCLSGNYYLDLYSFSATQNQTVTITASGTTAYQMLVTVQRRSDGVVVAQNNGYAPVSLTYTFPTTDTYYIGFGYVATFNTSQYSIVVHCGSSSGNCTASQNVSVNDLVGGTLNASTGTACKSGSYYQVYYTLSAQKDVPLILTLNANGFSPFISVGDTSQDHGVWAGSSTSNVASVTYYPTYTGTHAIYISSNAASQTGSYVLTVGPSTADQCHRRAVSH